MTDEKLQTFCGQNVRLKYREQVLEGKLICGGTAQLTVDMPYAIEAVVHNATLGTYDSHLAGIIDAESVESVELVDEPVDEEIKDAAEDAQTPG
jgi:hypothetical protein